VVREQELQAQLREQEPQVQLEAWWPEPRRQEPQAQPGECTTASLFATPDNDAAGRRVNRAGEALGTGRKASAKEAVSASEPANTENRMPH